MTQNEKHAKTQKTQKSPKTVHTKIFFTKSHQNRLNFSFVKDIHVDGANLA